MKKFIVGLGTIALAATLAVSPVLTYNAQAFRGNVVIDLTDPDMIELLNMADAALQEILEQKDVMALVYLADKYKVKAQPDAKSATVVTVASGQQVWVQDAVLTESGETWIQVKCTVQGQEYTGYVNRQNLACSDELFLDWEAEYGMNRALFSTYTESTVSGGDSQTLYPDIEQFPESYREALTVLKEAHPNWTFVKMETGLEWDTVVEEELKGGRSLIYGSSATAMKEGLFGQNWYYASEEALEYYLDPRNGLTESGIFQFEQLTYNESYHKEEAVQGFLDNTFMKGLVPDTVMTYAHVLTAIGKEYNVSPFHLASRIYQEQGAGTSAMISGTYPGYEGYYNYYNIGASGKTDKEVIENGLAYAKAQNWNSHYLALHFGAEVIVQNYISKGQDTLYLQKFDVDNSDGELYWHQYMQNIGAPTSEGKNIRKLYEEAGSVDNTFVFKIPVYDDMPETACEKPTTSNRVVLNIPDGYEKPEVYLDGEPVTAVKKNGYYVAEATDSEAKTAVMYQYNENNVPIGMSVWKLTFDGSGYVVDEIEGLKDLLTFHGFSIRITGKSGIRFKSGIDQTTKASLTGDGIEGYKVKEYGTLLLPETLLGEASLLLTTDKVGKGLSYGTDESGATVDKVLEQVNGRDRFASVLVGLPVSQYETVFAFRAYMILEQDGKEIVLYGPQRSQSIYNLAEQMLAANLYQEGSSPYLFLKQLIADADAYVPPSVSGNN